MGYFEGLTSGSFKTTPDGRWLFFPWGVLGRGYSVASEQDYQRLRGQIRAYVVVAFVLILGADLFVGYAACLTMAAIVCTFYLGWMWYLLPRLKFSGEKMSLQESMTSSAHAHSVFGLRAMQIGSLVLMAGGFVMLVADSNQRLVAFAAIFFFGLCLASATYKLSLRQRLTDEER